MGATVKRHIDMVEVRARLAQGDTIASIARDMGIPRKTLSHRVHNPQLDKVKVGSTATNGAAAGPKRKISTPKATAAETVYKEDEDGTATVSSNSARIQTISQLLQVTKVDLEYWEPYDGVVQSYEGMRKAVVKELDFDEGRISGSVRDQGKLTVVTMYKIQVKLRKRKEKTALELAEFFRNTLEQSPKRKFAYIMREDDKDGDDLEINMTDVHLGMLSWKPETGDTSWNTERCLREFQAGGETLVRRAERMGPLRKITIPFGNDFFNSDNGRQETTRGTSQHDDSRWQYSFRIGSEAVAKLAETFGNKYEVELVLVQGNHDEERAFYLGEYLRAYFRGHARVTVDNEPCLRKYRLHGCTLVGYEHGHGPKPKDLPMIMAQEAPPEMWVKAKFKEWHHGHIHHEKTLDDGNVTLRWFRALCPHSAWAASKYGRGIRGAQAIRYSDKFGPLDQYNWFPDVTQK